MSMKDFSSLKDILKAINQALPFNLEDGEIWKVWKEVVGDYIATHARPAWIRNKVLAIHVSSPIWMQELRYRASEIKEKLNKRLGRDSIEEIKFFVGKEDG